MCRGFCFTQNVFSACNEFSFDIVITLCSCYPFINDRICSGVDYLESCTCEFITCYCGYLVDTNLSCVIFHFNRLNNILTCGRISVLDRKFYRLSDNITCRSSRFSKDICMSDYEHTFDYFGFAVRCPDKVVSVSIFYDFASSFVCDFKGCTLEFSRFVYLNFGDFYFGNFIEHYDKRNVVLYTYLVQIAVETACVCYLSVCSYLELDVCRYNISVRSNCFTKNIVACRYLRKEFFCSC